MTLPCLASQSQAAAVFRLCGYKLLDITAAHAGAVDDLPVFANHRDPFDRTLVARALQETMVLLTNDARLPQCHPVLIVAAWTWPRVDLLPCRPMRQGALNRSSRPKP